jgi:hypothetical protein
MKNLLELFTVLLLLSSTAHSAEIEECRSFHANINPQALLKQFVVDLRSNVVDVVIAKFKQSNITVTPDLIEWNLAAPKNPVVDEDGNLRWRLQWSDQISQIVVHAPKKNYILTLWPEADGPNEAASCFSSDGYAKIDCLDIYFERARDSYIQFNSLGEPTAANCTSIFNSRNADQKAGAFVIEYPEADQPVRWNVKVPAYRKDQMVVLQ